ncbi:tyrosine recombinase XerC [Actinomycetospora sp. TBRC 11914]|uniref:site-specific integrase n=1 Tax=Actinomycetospora sp. TBRC 11914 TaxID=2729387 RepID=UPI00145D6EA6|nr:site-specific integrase [Actinomycetospora sp. TBRC 11914]NMO93116.1 site-specific integrase [Actinomycetospora sp. TBRC 11914]
MGRPPMPIGSHGKLRHYPYESGGVSGWVVTTKFRDLDGVVRTVKRSGKTKAAAERNLKKAIQDRQPNSGSPVTGDTKVAALVELFLEETKRRRRGTTYDTYAFHAHHTVVPALGQLRIREATVARLDGFFRTCEGHLSPNTVRSIRTVVSGSFSYAARLGAIPTNPVRDVGRIEGTKKDVRALTRRERVDLLARLDDDEEAYRFDVPDLVRFMLGTGCRIGEVIAVQDDAIDWQRGTVAVVANIVRVKQVGLVRHSGKTFSAQRVLPLPTFVRTTLAERRPDDVLPTSMVFPNSRGHALGRGSWRDPHNTGARLRTALDRAGYGWVTSHAFRKTAATVLDQAGLSARAIAGHIGHARPSITQDVYMDKRSAGRQAADAFDAVWGPDEESE